MRPGAGFLQLLIILGLVLLPSLAIAQTSEPAEIIRVDSDLVDLKVSVMRMNTLSPVTQLQQSDFLILEDGKPQEISFFAAL